MNCESIRRLARRCSAAVAVAAALTLQSCTETGNADGNAQPTAQATPAARTTAEGTTTLVYDVKGMHCDACAAAIDSAVGKLAGVQSCTASFEQGSAMVVVDDPDTSTQIIDAVAKLGYTIEPKPKDNS